MTLLCRPTDVRKVYDLPEAMILIRALHKKCVGPSKERGQARLPDLETLGLARLLSR
jgi:hypothetical protein